MGRGQREATGTHHRTSSRDDADDGDGDGRREGWSPVQRMLVGTDGTVTRMLEAFTDEEIKVVKLEQSFGSIGVPPGEESEGLALESEAGATVIRRSILLRGRESRTNYVQAQSVVLVDRVPVTFVYGMIYTNKPVGLLLAGDRVETSREILRVEQEPAGERGTFFGVDPRAPMIVRTYRIVVGRLPALLITERFPTMFFKDGLASAGRPTPSEALSVFPDETLTDHEVAARVATEAGELLVALRRDLAATDDATRRAEGDRQAHERIMALLARWRPDDAVLSEESADNREARLAARRTWIVDPLDGTREFGETGRTDWAVHVALVEAGVLVAGAVALPALGLTFSSDPPPPPPPGHNGRVRIAVSRTRPPAAARAVQDGLGAETVPMGSAGAKAMAVVTGDADVYLHAGGQYEWDSAAPAAVAVAAGLHVSRLDGDPLRYNQPDPWLPDFLVCRPELAADVIRIAREAAPPPS